MVNDISLLTKQEIKSLIALRRDAIRTTAKELQGLWDELELLEKLLGESGEQN
jgi:hypothetical protein